MIDKAVLILPLFYTKTKQLVTAYSFKLLVDIFVPAAVNAVSIYARIVCWKTHFE